MQLDWHDIFALKTGVKLKAEEAVLWTQELQKSLRRFPPTNDDIKNALSWAFGPEHLYEYKKRSAYDRYDEPFLCRILIDWRKYKTLSAMSGKDLLAEYRRQIRMATDDYDIWEIVCTPVKSDDCAILEKYAELTHKGWDRAKGNAVCDAF